MRAAQAEDDRQRAAALAQQQQADWEAQQREVAWQAERARLDAEVEQICLAPPGERTRDMCAERRVRQQMANEQATRDQHEQDRAAVEERSRAVEAEYYERQRQQEAIRGAFVMPPAPVAAPAAPRNCTSLVNGNLITTNCF